MFTCDLCGESFTQNRNLSRHIINIHGRKELKCFHCDYVTTRKDNLVRHMKSKHLAKRSANETTTEPKNKKRRTDDWDEGDLSSLDIDNLIPLIEADNWDGEELSSTDIDNLIPLVEPEKEKIPLVEPPQVGGDLWAENDVEPEPEKQAFKCPHCSLQLVTSVGKGSHEKII